MKFLRLIRGNLHQYCEELFVCLFASHRDRIFLAASKLPRPVVVLTGPLLIVSISRAVATFFEVRDVG